MLDKIARRMTPEEFYAWQEGMDEKYELVDGYPVPRCPDIEMMTGASRRHDQIVVNLIGEFGRQLRGGPYRGFTSDTAVRTPQGRRRPDAGVECGKLDDQSYEAGEVRMVVEVLSPSTRDLDTFAKLDEYKEIDSIDHILLVEPNMPQAVLWFRTAERFWAQEMIEGVESSIKVESLGLALKMQDIYEGLTFRPAPRLVDGAGR